MRKKSQTLIERFGFNDKDLKTPIHDKILLWCLNKNNLYDLLFNIGIIPKRGTRTTLECSNFGRTYWSEGKQRVLCDWDWETGECSANCVELPEPPGEPSYYTGKEDWPEDWVKCNERKKQEYERKKEKYEEEVKREKNERIRLIKYFKDAYKAIKDINEDEIKRLFIENCFDEILAEYAIKSNNYNIGFVDLFVSLRSMSDDGFFIAPFKIDKSIAIEIKPKVESIGETIRQINLYRSHLQKDTVFLLITFTTGLKDVFSSQNIHIYEIDEEIIK